MKNSWIQQLRQLSNCSLGLTPFVPSLSCWLIYHVIYLKLRRKLLLSKLSQNDKYFHSKLKHIVAKLRIACDFKMSLTPLCPGNRGACGNCVVITSKIRSFCRLQGSKSHRAALLAQFFTEKLVHLPTKNNIALFPPFPYRK